MHVGLLELLLALLDIYDPRNLGTLVTLSKIQGNREFQSQLNIGALRVPPRF